MTRQGPPAKSRQSFISLSSRPRGLSGGERVQDVGLARADVRRRDQRRRRPQTRPSRRRSALRLLFVQTGSQEIHAQRQRKRVCGAERGEQ